MERDSGWRTRVQLPGGIIRLRGSLAGRGKARRGKARQGKGPMAKTTTRSGNLIESREDYPALVDAIYQRTTGLNRGDTLLHEEIETILGFSRDDDRATYHLLVNKCRKQILEERGIATLPVPTVGYELLTVKRQVTDYDQIRLKKANRQLRKASRALDYLPDSDLDLSQKALKYAKMQMLQQSRSQLRQKARLDEAFARPQQRNPIGPIPGQNPEQTA